MESSWNGKILRSSKVLSNVKPTSLQNVKPKGPALGQQVNVNGGVPTNAQLCFG